MPMRYQLARPTRLNQSGMKPPAKGRDASGAGAPVAEAASAVSDARLLRNFTLTPLLSRPPASGVAPSYTLGARPGLR